MQCGIAHLICVSAKALLEKNPKPTEDDCKQRWPATSVAAAHTPGIPPLLWKRRRRYRKEHSMADLAGVNGTRKDFRVVGKRIFQECCPGRRQPAWQSSASIMLFPICSRQVSQKPYANARIKNLDITKAKAVPGSSTSSPGKTRTSRS